MIIFVSCSDLELIRSDIPFLPSHLSVHSTTFPLMPAPRTPVPTRNSSSSGVVLTTRGGRGLGKFGPLLTILGKKPTLKPSQVPGPWSAALGVSGRWENQVVLDANSAGGICCQFLPVQAVGCCCCTQCTQEYICTGPICHIRDSHPSVNLFPFS